MKRVILIGRPNVGKSAIYNALLGYRRANVLDLEGTTIDTLTERVNWEEGKFELSDTRGTFGEGDEEIIRALVAAADACLLVFDAISGLNPVDEWIAQLVMQAKKPVLVVVNKSEGKRSEAYLDFLELGFEDILPISAAHRTNFAALKEWCIEVTQSDGEASAPTLCTLSILGRPNVGKSTLMNYLCGDSISKVSAKAHTTRDPVSSTIKLEKGLIRVLDTAGIRRRKSKASHVETYSVQASRRMALASDVVLLMISSEEPMTDQDLALMEFLDKIGKSTVVLFNFWDKLGETEQKAFLLRAKGHPILRRFKTLPVSALSGTNLNKVLPTLLRLAEKSKKRIPTSDLNAAVKGMVLKNPPPASGKGNFNILYTTQVSLKPPTFVFFMNRKDALPVAYQRYLTNELRKRFDFKGQPIRLRFRGGDKRQ